MKASAPACFQLEAPLGLKGVYVCVVVFERCLLSLLGFCVDLSTRSGSPVFAEVYAGEQ